MFGYFAVATLAILAAHAYFASSLVVGITSPRQRRTLRRLLFANAILVPGLMVLLLRAPPTWSFWAVPLAHVVFGDAGLCIMLLCALVARDVIWLTARRLGHDNPSDPERRAMLARGLNMAAVGTAVGLTAAGYVEARAQPEVVRTRLGCAGTPRTWSGMRIVQVSDLHVGPTIRREYVETLVERVNALAADVVVLTGDLVDGLVSQLATQVEPLGRIAARHGVYFVTGNHEYYHHAREWKTAFRAMGIVVLSNEHTVIDHGGVPVLLAGIEDPTSRREAAEDRREVLGRSLATCARRALRILLAHRPGDAPWATEQRFDLQLSGHMHAGQFFPLTILLRAFAPFVAGLYRVGDMLLYVNRGAGYWGPPNRLGARQEVSVLEICAR